jgi:hypothetical protein
MIPAPAPTTASEWLVAYYPDGERMRSRSVGDTVLSGTVPIPPLPRRLLADWEREMAEELALEPGDVESLNLPRARLRWPAYRQCVQAMDDWGQAIGLPDILADGRIALMACRGARYHLDAELYGGAAFCNLFVSEDKGLDLHFPDAGHRIPLQRGTVVVFDTGQPHAVLQRGRTGFVPQDYAAPRDCALVFLTWELPLERAELARALGIRFDVDAGTAARLGEAQVWHQGSPADLCPESGRWRRR